MITPIDIETVEFKKVALGYAPDAVDEFLNKVIVDVEKLYKENSSYRDKIRNLEETISYYKSLEDTIRNSIMLAEKASEQSRQNAAEKAAVILEKAQKLADEKLLSANKELYETQARIADLRTRFDVLSKGIKNLIETELDYIEKCSELIEKADFSSIEEAAAADETETEKNNK